MSHHKIKQEFQNCTRLWADGKGSGVGSQGVRGWEVWREHVVHQHPGVTRVPAYEGTSLMCNTLHNRSKEDLQESNR